MAAAAAQLAVGVIAPSHLAATAVQALAARGIEARPVDAGVEARPTRGGDTGIIGWALDAPPPAKLALELAATCARAAAAGRPVCLLAPAPRGSGRTAIERAATLSYLRAHGAALCHDVDVWLEAMVALVRFGLPPGPRCAVIAPAGSWLEAQTQALSLEADLVGARPPVVAKADDPTDVILYDEAAGPPPAGRFAIAVVPRGELVDPKRPALFGVRAALGAIEILGRAAQRIAIGLGPADVGATAELAIDAALLARSVAKHGPEPRLGDHETKLLLRAYGVAITRQTVATTPSAAVKDARKVGFPVEIKPWGFDVPSEPAGCPVERGITSDALVRRGFSAVLAAAGRLPTTTDGGAVIVREAPPPGREVSATFVKLPALGWTVVLDVPGAPAIAAAPAPLRLVDAQALAATLVASRAADAEPDRAGLANLLRRASHLVVDLDARLTRLELSRIVVGARGSRTLVIDAYAELS